MQLKDIAKGLREAATLLPSDPRERPGVNRFSDIPEEDLPLCAAAEEFYTAMKGPLKIKLGTCTYSFETPCRERLERAATIAARGVEEVGTAAFKLRVDRADKIPTGKRPPRSVLQDFLADGEVENAQQYAELTSSEAILAELLK